MLDALHCMARGGRNVGVSSFLYRTHIHFAWSIVWSDVGVGVWLKAAAICTISIRRFVVDPDVGGNARLREAREGQGCAGEVHLLHLGGVLRREGESEKVHRANSRGGSFRNRLGRRCGRSFGALRPNESSCDRRTRDRVTRQRALQRRQVDAKGVVERVRTIPFDHL